MPIIFSESFMNIGNVQSITPLGVGSVIRARGAVTKLPVPVRQGEYIYAKFKHIFGFRSFDRSEGYSVNKLRALDNLIDRMKVLGKETPDTVDMQSTSVQEIDDLIGSFHGQIHNAIQNITPSPAVNAEFSALSVDVTI